MHLLDTDVMIEYLRGSRETQETVDRLPELYTTHINLAELFYGAYKSGNVKRHLEKLRCFMEGVEVVHMSAESAELYGRIKTVLNAKGKTAGDFDLLIASICVANNLTIMTKNTSHYRDIPGLKIRSIG